MSMCGTHVLPHATKLWAWVGRETWPVSCTCSLMWIHINIYIAPPLGAFKSQLGGTYILAVGLYRHRLLWFLYMYTYLYVYIRMYFHHIIWLLVSLHVRWIPQQSSQWQFWASVCVCCFLSRCAFRKHNVRFSSLLFLSRGLFRKHNVKCSSLFFLSRGAFRQH